MTPFIAHRWLRASLLVLAALAACAALATSPARADNPSAQFYGTTDSTQTTRWCQTPWVGGVWHAYGAWGYYIDGCTASVQCPWSRCRSMQASGELRTASGYTTCNTAVRIYNVYGSLRYRADYSGSGGNGSCWIARGAPDAGYGEWVTVQTNGVIAYNQTASVKSYIWLAPV
jgi:hypothetical protein